MEDKFVCRICGCVSCTLIYDRYRCDDCSVTFESPDAFTLPLVKFIKLDEDAVEPVRAKDGDVGYDAVSIMDMEIFPNETKMIKTGIAVELPPNTEMQVRARSGLAKNHSIIVTNGPGTIDTGYRGPCNVLLTNVGKEKYTVSKGDKIAQFLVTTKLPYTFKKSESLSESDRGEGGFGHTGK